MTSHSCGSFFISYVGKPEAYLVLNIGNVLSRNLTFDLKNVAGFPNDVYESNRRRYEEFETWYDGTILEDQNDQSGRDVDIYPVRINPVRGAVMKHAAVLFGDVVDDGRPLVIPRMVFGDDELYPSLHACRIAGSPIP